MPITKRLKNIGYNPLYKGWTATRNVKPDEVLRRLGVQTIEQARQVLPGRCFVPLNKAKNLGLFHRPNSAGRYSSFDIIVLTSEHQNRRTP